MYFKTKTAAYEASRNVKAQLDHHWPKWKLRVWENLGWHYDLRHGPLSLSPCGAPGFMCLVCRLPESDGSGIYGVNYEHFAKTAVATVKLAVKSVRPAIQVEIDCYQAVINALSKVK